MSVISMGAMGPAAAQPETACSIELSAAEQRYQNGAFGEAIRLISECLDQARVSPEQAVRAYRMLALAHLKRDELTAARSAIINLLGAQPEYTPDPVDEPPVFVSMVSLVRRELHLDSSAVSVQEVPPLPPSPVEDVDVARTFSTRSLRGMPQAFTGSEKWLQKMGW